MSEYQSDEQPPGNGQANDDEDRGNEIGYRNVDEDAEHDERGSQGPGPREQPPREQ